MTTMLGEVVRNGTGACAAIPGYTVAGKTGTSRKAAPQGGYTRPDDGVVRRVRAGREPAARGDRRPRRARERVRSVAAAPVFSEIVQSALTQYRVPPDRRRRRRGSTTLARAHADDQGSNCTVLHGAALQEHLAQQAAAAAAAAKAAADARAASSTRSGIGNARYPRRRHVPERVGGRVRMHDLLDGLDVLAIHGDPDVDVRSVVHDSRDVAPGALFACIRGAVTDGHAYAAAAVGAGAVALLVEEHVDVDVRHAGSGRVGARACSGRSRLGSTATRRARCGSSVSPERTARRR